jgi:cytochrome P450
MNARASFIEALELSALVDDLGTGLYASSLTEGSRSRFGRALAAKNEIIEFIEGQRSALKTSNLGSVGLSNGDLLDQALTFLFAGVDTISATLTWAFDNLIQRHTKGISNLSESEAFTDALASYPPVYFIPRGAVATVDIGGVTVNRGWNVNVMISELHKRFMQTGDQASFMPFGIGPKRCPAQSYSHIIGARLLQTFLKEFCVEVEPWDTKALRFVPGLRPAASPRLAIAKASI